MDLEGKPSHLDSQSETVDDPGESGDTFYALRWATVSQPSQPKSQAQSSTKSPDLVVVSGPFQNKAGNHRRPWWKWRYGQCYSFSHLNRKPHPRLSDYLNERSKPFEFLSPVVVPTPFNPKPKTIAQFPWKRRHVRCHPLLGPLSRRSTGYCSCRSSCQRLGLPWQLREGCPCLARSPRLSTACGCFGLQALVNAWMGCCGIVLCMGRCFRAGLI